MWVHHIEHPISEVCCFQFEEADIQEALYTASEVESLVGHCHEVPQRVQEALWLCQATRILALCAVDKIKEADLLLDEAKISVPDADIILFLVDVSTPAGKGDKWIVENVLKNVSIPVVIVLNKTDKVSPKKIDENILSYKTLCPDYVDIIRISAKTGKNKIKLIEIIKKYLPEGEKYYPEDIVTEENMRSIAEEVIREKILINTSDEIPHAVAVRVDEYKEDADIDRIYATIYCETKSQKGILIGKGGSLLKLVGTAARQDLEKIVDKKVFLGLQVKVEKDWRKKDKALKSFGYVQ